MTVQRQEGIPSPKRTRRSEISCFACLLCQRSDTLCEPASVSTGQAHSCSFSQTIQGTGERSPVLVGIPKSTVICVIPYAQGCVGTEIAQSNCPPQSHHLIVRKSNLVGKSSPEGPRPRSLAMASQRSHLTSRRLLMKHVVFPSSPLEDHASRPGILESQAKDGSVD